MSRYEMQYSLQRQLANVERRAGAIKVINATTEKHLVIECKRNRRKTATQFTADS